MAKVLDALEKARLARLDSIREASGEMDASILPQSQPPEGTPAQSITQTQRSKALTSSPNPVGLHGITEQIVSAYDNQSPIAEQLRHIRTNLETVLADYRSRPIVISSPVTGDGKSLVTANLSVVLADAPEHRCLIIDADMRKPDMHRLFGIRQKPGLAEYLQHQCTMDEAICTTGLPNLDVMPAGRSPESPTALLGSDLMPKLLGDLQNAYRWIIIDTPPLLPVTDACVLARDCIGLILVTRMGQTPRNLIEHAQQMLGEMNLPILGCILNDFTTQSKQHDYYYKYYGKKKSQGTGFES